MLIISAILPARSLMPQNVTEVKIYPFKSAVISYRYEASFAGTRELYIDGYGYLQADYTDKSENFGGNSGRENTITIIKGEKVYLIDLMKNTLEAGRNLKYGYYTENRDKPAEMITEAIRKEAEGWHKAGYKSFLGKECTLWKAGNNTLLTWRGLELMKVINFMTMTVEKAVSVEIDAVVRDEIFGIPDNLEYIPSDIYYGPGGLKLNFNGENPSGSGNEKGITINFDSADLEGCGSFLYRDKDGNGILLTGDNDFNKIDSEIIRSQRYAMTAEKILLPPSKTLIFITEKGFRGKMQINRTDREDYSFRYMIFDGQGTVREYSADTNNALGSILEIRQGKNGELIIKSLNNTGYTVL